MTCRFRGHYEGDSQEYRDREELDRLKLERDPVQLLGKKIRAAGGAATSELETVERSVAAEVDAAARKALNGTLPPRERIFQYVYA
jgi:TPP-dependent pyruvate/acetoin dehydrogenase alpha subunit